MADERPEQPAPARPPPTPAPGLGLRRPIPEVRTDLKTIRSVVGSDLTGGAWREAMDRVCSTCFFCRAPLGATSVLIVTDDERDQRLFGIYPHMRTGRLVTPSAFAHAACALRAEEASP